MDEIIEGLEVHDGLPKIHHVAMLVVGTVVGFLANDAAKKGYVKAYHAIKAAKS
jgi:hypothetical protein